MASLRALVGDVEKARGLLARVQAEARAIGRAPHPDVREALRLLASLRRALVPAAAPPPVDPGQERLVLPMASDAIVWDCPLGCPVSALVCTSRQIQSDMETKGVGETTRACRRRADPNRPAELARHDAKRGTKASRPTCVTSHCAVGADVRERHGDTERAVEMAKRAPRATDTSE